MNAKQKRFCDEYLIDCNATQAAIRAGYSEKTAERASDWINEKGQEKPSSKYNPELRAYIDENLERLHNEKTADAREIMEYLTSVIRSESEKTGNKLKAAELIGKILNMFDKNSAEKDSDGIGAFIAAVLPSTQKVGEMFSDE